MARCATTSQTVGPFFQIGFELLMKPDIAGPGVPGERITLEGQVLDGDRVPIPDAVIELWQPNSHGKYAHPEDRQDKPVDSGFSGYGRVGTDDNGYYRIRTIKPGSTPGLNGSTQAPHLAVSVFMRGLLRHLFTRVYFPDDPANSNDPILNMVPAARRHTLIARKTSEGVLRWDVLMQGPDETVFFDV
jgi:protocatechuate 3,4-dioxygenase, alpha subunit